MTWSLSIAISENATLTPIHEPQNQKLTYNLWKKKANLPDELQSTLNTLSVYFDLSSTHVGELRTVSYCPLQNIASRMFVCYILHRANDVLIDEYFAGFSYWYLDMSQVLFPPAESQQILQFNSTICFLPELCFTVQQKGCICDVQQRTKRSQKRLLALQRT